MSLRKLKRAVARSQHIRNLKIAKQVAQRLNPPPSKPELNLNATKGVWYNHDIGEWMQWNTEHGCWDICSWPTTKP